MVGKIPSRKQGEQTEGTDQICGCKNGGKLLESESLQETEIPWVVANAVEGFVEANV